MKVVKDITEYNYHHVSFQEKLEFWMKVYSGDIFSIQAIEIRIENPEVGCPKYVDRNDPARMQALVAILALAKLKLIEKENGNE